MLGYGRSGTERALPPATALGLVRIGIGRVCRCVYCRFGGARRYKRCGFGFGHRGVAGGCLRLGRCCLARTGALGLGVRFVCSRRNGFGRGLCGAHGVIHRFAARNRIDAIAADQAGGVGTISRWLSVHGRAGAAGSSVCDLCMTVA